MRVVTGKSLIQLFKDRNQLNRTKESVSATKWGEDGPVGRPEMLPSNLAPTLPHPPRPLLRELRAEGKGGSGCRAH